MSLPVSRRTIFRAGVLTGLVSAVASVLPTTAAWAEERRKPKDTSANGWAIQGNKDAGSQVWTRTVAGTGLSVPVWLGDVEVILLHVARRFHYEVEEIAAGGLVGWTPAGEVRKGLPESNLASGTAIRIRPGSRVKGGFFPLQEMALRDILADCEGLVRWGGDDREVDESLFYIAAGPRDRRVHKLANRLRGFETTPGAGAGVREDFLAGPRRNRAETLARSQRRR